MLTYVNKNMEIDRFPLLEAFKISDEIREKKPRKTILSVVTLRDFCVILHPNTDRVYAATNRFYHLGRDKPDHQSTCRM